MTHAHMQQPMHAPTRTADYAHVVAAAPEERSHTRVLFVDWLRLLAAFQMLQGHTIAALLAPAERVGLWYALWSWARGLTSVAFLFAAGMSFYIATARNYVGHRDDPRAISKRVRRGLKLISIGYLLHAPALALFTENAVGAQSALASWLQVDVLQCIGVTLLCLEGCVVVLRRPEQLAAVAAVAATTLFACTPIATQDAWPSLPHVIAAYLTPRHGSLFPLLPWSAHMFAGAAVAALVMRDRKRAPRLLLGMATLFILVAHALHVSSSQPVLYDHASRAGAVLLVCALLAALTRRAPRMPRPLAALAGETLFLYVFHVVLVYGDGLGLAARVGASLGAWGAVGCAVAVVVASCVAGLGYHAFKVRRARRAA